MTTKELENRVQVTWCGCGQYRVSIDYRGKVYHCHSNNSLAWDRYHDGQREYEPDCKVLCSYTYKQSLMAFYGECKRKNNL